jgi:hypothetical protein
MGGFMATASSHSTAAIASALINDISGGIYQVCTWIWIKGLISLMTIPITLK